MGKLISSGEGIEKQSNKLSLVSDSKERTLLIGEYLYKYAAIANRNIDSELIAIYVEALSDLSLNRIRAGLKNWLENGDRFPWPNNIREEAEL